MKRLQVNDASLENMLETLLKRSPNQYDEYQQKVTEILGQVRAKGDEALFAYTKQFDGADITKESIRVTEKRSKRRTPSWMTD